VRHRHEGAKEGGSAKGFVGRQAKSGAVRISREREGVARGEGGEARQREGEGSERKSIHPLFDKN